MRSRFFKKMQSVYLESMAGRVIVYISTKRPPVTMKMWKSVDEVKRHALDITGLETGLQDHTQDYDSVY
jgi:hypothetical protein